MSDRYMQAFGFMPAQNVSLFSFPLWQDMALSMPGLACCNPSKESEERTNRALLSFALGDF